MKICICDEFVIDIERTFKSNVDIINVLFDNNVVVVILFFLLIFHRMGMVKFKESSFKGKKANIFNQVEEKGSALDIILLLQMFNLI